MVIKNQMNITIGVTKGKAIHMKKQRQQPKQKRNKTTLFFIFGKSVVGRTYSVRPLLRYPKVVKRED
jgi:hypothetical protein